MPNEIFPETEWPHPVPYATWTHAKWFADYDKLILEGKLALAIGKRLSDLSALLHLPFPCQKSADIHSNLAAVGPKSLGDFQYKGLPGALSDLVRCKNWQWQQDGHEQMEGEEQMEKVN